MMAAMGGLDALAFTGGIGENDAAIRAAIMDGMAWTGLVARRAGDAEKGPRLHQSDSSVEAWIVPADEETTIARDAAALIASLPTADPA